MEKKTIKVVAAIICKDNKVLATQRGYGDYKDWWEFPGGKIEPGETPEAALAREIRGRNWTRKSTWSSTSQRWSTTTRSSIYRWIASGAQ